MRNTESADYVEDQRKTYSLYVLNNRAIPALTDGLKPSARRILWTARNGKTYKTATLAGATMPIHPHAAPEKVINTLSAPYRNNIPLLSGEGAFGTLLNTTAYGASRYTSTAISQFTKDVVFRDMDLVPMIDNYDSTQKEPKHFLPLVATAFLNRQEGIAIGFSSTILPRSLAELIELQIAILQDKKRIKLPSPLFTPTDSRGTETGPNTFQFSGVVEKESNNCLRITKLPYGIEHRDVIEKLSELIVTEEISDYEDNSKDTIDIKVKVKPQTLKSIDSTDQLLSTFGLLNTEKENPVLLDINMRGVKKFDILKAIRTFTEWRLQWYKKRFEKLKAKSDDEIRKLEDLIIAIENDIGHQATKIKNKTALRAFVKEIGVHNIEYIVNMPLYQFTEDEKRKAESRLRSERQDNAKYAELIDSEIKRKRVYIKELREILKNYDNGVYNTNFE